MAWAGNTQQLGRYRLRHNTAQGYTLKHPIHGDFRVKAFKVLYAPRNVDFAAQNSVVCTSNQNRTSSKGSTASGGRNHDAGLEGSPASGQQRPIGSDGPGRSGNMAVGGTGGDHGRHDACRSSCHDCKPKPQRQLRAMSGTP